MLRQIGIVPEPLVPLGRWAAPRTPVDGVYKDGAVLLGGDLLLEALNGDAIARQQLKQRQAMRKQQDLRRYVGMQQQAEAQAKRALWTAQQGMQGRKAAVQKTVVLRREPDLSSEKVGRVPKGAHVHVLEMKPPDRDGVRRALVQDVWGKNSGWMTAVEVDGEQNLVADLPQADVEAEDDGRGGWLQRVRAPASFSAASAAAHTRGPCRGTRTRPPPYTPSVSSPLRPFARVRAA